MKIKRIKYFLEEEKKKAACGYCIQGSTLSLI